MDAWTAAYAQRLEQENEVTTNERWPEPLASEALHGLAGDIVRAIEPHTESDPAAILAQVLVSFGSIVGRGPHYRVEGDKHGGNLFAVVVGQSSKARKGTSAGRVRQVFDCIDDRWAKDRVLSGLSSGEGLIWAVRDAVSDEDSGIDDKRLLVIESEFASLLRVLQREGNTLSAIIRNAWDRGDLRTMTKNSPAVATDAHISIIGHITVDELRRYLDRTEAANGLANRFLFIAARRSKVLPFGGQDVDLSPHAREIAGAIAHARTIGRITFDEHARVIWAKVYPDLSEGLPGLLGAVTSRAEAQVVRLSVLYALLDRSNVIRPEHLNAAIAVWEYAEASARYIFGDTLGDPMADELLRAIQASANGMSRTEMRDLFKRHKSSEQIGAALKQLQTLGRITRRSVNTGGRPTEVWVDAEKRTVVV